MKHFSPWVIFCILIIGINFACQPSNTGAANTYILAVQPDSLSSIYPEGQALAPDTIHESDPIRIYGMAVQRYAAALFFVHEMDSKHEISLDGIKISDLAGLPVTLAITQEQRDSVIMDFIKFTRRSTIPYQETIKNFELKMMEIR